MSWKLDILVGFLTLKTGIVVDSFTCLYDPSPPTGYLIQLCCNGIHLVLFCSLDVSGSAVLFLGKGKSGGSEKEGR